MDEVSVIAYRGFRFLITKTPGTSSLDSYIKELKRHNCQNLIRVCEATYDTHLLKLNGIAVHDLPIPDGNFPSESVLQSYFALLKNQYLADPESCVAIHCVAGLGRAPVMVAVALIELGYSYEDAVELIREKRRGAINAKQLEYLSKYKSQERLTNDRRKSCSIQ